MTATRRLLATLALLPLGVLAACGGDPEPDPARSAGAAPSAAAFAADPATSEAATVAGLLDSLVRTEGLTARTEDSTWDAPSQVPAERLQVAVGDHAGDWVQGGWLYVFPDGAAAEAGAQAALAQDVAAEDVPVETATAEVVGNVVWVRRMPLESPPTQGERATLACLPGGDPAVRPAAPPTGTVLPGALLGCVTQAGADPTYDKSWSDDETDKWGHLAVLYLDDTTQSLWAHVYQDATAAAAGQQQLDRADRRRSVLAGNVLAVWEREPKRPGPEAAAVQACLPSAAPAAYTFDEELVVTDGPSSGLLAGCLIDHDVVADGPIGTELLGGSVPSDEVEWTATDTDGLDPQHGVLYVFADPATATTHAEAAYDRELGSSIGEGSSWSQHGNVVLMLDRPVGEPASPMEQAVLSCLPGGEPGPAVADPARGTHTVGSVLACTEAAGVHASGWHDVWDEGDGLRGRVDTRYFDDYQQATVIVHTDAAGALAAYDETADPAEPGQVYVAGNALVEFAYPIDATLPQTAAVLGCLPA